MKDRSLTFGLFILGLMLMGFLATAFLQRPVEMPGAFADGTSFQDAVSQSNETGKPVLIFATADWCRPCQHLKKTTLTDERVESAIRQRTVPVYLDLTDPQPNTAEADVAQQMQISSLPTMVLWRPGGEISRRVGAMPAVDMLSWLEAH